MKLIIGNKNYSSWSLRPWLVLKHLDIPFEEVLIPLYQQTTAQKIKEHSASGKVPVLIDDDIQIWDSMAICEYLDEKYPNDHLWPQDLKARAVARSVSAEMHSGFVALRQNLPMNIRKQITLPTLEPLVRKDMDRIEQIWMECRTQFGKKGPFLFGKFSIADAMYAPVVLRFKTYGLEVHPTSQEYMNQIMALPALGEWIKEAIKESHVVGQFER